MASNVIVRYRLPSGDTREWVVQYERLEHVLKVCEEKGFIVIGLEELS
jgi:hypothetical protein